MKHIDTKAQMDQCSNIPYWPRDATPPIINMGGFAYFLKSPSNGGVRANPSGH